jgi:N-acetylated-alpha-linked acidic dipeptidase
MNSDDTSKGWLHVSGSHTLEEFVAEVAGAVEQPGTSTNLAYASLHRTGDNNTGEARPARRAAKDSFTIGALGAGSDYVAFIDYLGVASMNEGFGGQTKSGIYHSAYDDPYWYEHFSDSDFMDGRALAQYTATALLRLGDSTILPFEFGHFAKTVSGYLDEIEKEAQKSGKKLDFSALRSQIKQLNESDDKYNALLKTVVKKEGVDAGQLNALNTALMRTERVLTRPEGLPNRDWYKHQIYAPGFYTGYGVKTLPGIREAVDARNWDLAQKEAGIVDQCLAQMNQVVNEAYTALSSL